MTFKMGPVEDDITAKLKTINSRVYVSEVPPDASNFPLMVCYFGGPIRSGQDHSLRGSRSDTMIAYLTVQVMSTTDSSARDVADLVRDLLMGYHPTNCGEMVVEGGMNYSNVATSAAPTKYYREVAFTFRTNLADNN